MNDQPSERLARRDPVARLPRAIAGEPGLFIVDATWGLIQPLQLPGGVPTVGELEVLEHLRAGGALIDTRQPGHVAHGTLPGAVAIRHEDIVDGLAELRPAGPVVLFCNGPQCTATPRAVAALLAAGWEAARLRYYRGGVHDWVTLGLPLTRCVHSHGRPAPPPGRIPDDPGPPARDTRDMARRILILGAGTGGTLTANRLRRACGDEIEIVVVDRDDRHVYQPALLFVPFGLADPAEIVRSRRAQLHDGIEFRLAEIDHVDTAANTVHLDAGATIAYDVLVVASGASLLPEETEGLTGSGWGQKIFTFFELDSATALRDALAGFEAGRLVVNPIDMPIKCPVAPLEFCFLADWYLRERGAREAVELTYVTSLDGAFTKPVASGHLAGLLAEKGIALETEFATGEVDGEHGRLVSYDEREVPFDLLVSIPLHGGPAYVGRSPGLGDELGFVATDPHTLQAKAAANVFAIGDATNLPTSKAGSVTHFEGDTLVANIGHFLAGEPLEGSFDGHSNCFIETGFHKALLIDFNYDVEPLPGRFPGPHFGPLPLLKESRLNHMAKLAFQWVYWHMLLPGRDMPGISSQLQLAGKDISLLSTTEGASR